MDSENLVSTQSTENVVKVKSIFHPVDGDFYDRLYTFLALLIFPVPLAYILDYFLNFTINHKFLAGADILVLFLFVTISLILTICIYTKNRDAYIYSLGVGYIFTIIFLIYIFATQPIESPIFFIVFLVPFYLIPFYVVGILFRVLLNKGKVLGTVFSVVITTLLIIASQFIN